MWVFGFNLRKLTFERFILLQKGTDFLGPEGICTWRYSSQQRVMLSILQTELFQVCSCLGNFDAVEPGLQPELLNHFLHSGNAGGARHGAHDSQADSWVGGSWAVGRRGQTTKQRAAGAGLRTLSLSFRFCALRLHPRCACAPFPPSVPAPHQARSASLVEGEEKGRSSRWARLLGKRARLDS